MILDTSYFLELIAEHDTGVERTETFGRESVPLRVPAPVKYDLDLCAEAVEAVVELTGITGMMWRPGTPRFERNCGC